MAATLTLAVVIVESAFLSDDFGFELVQAHSSTTTPTFYKLTAMWSSQAGSLLLWAWVLSLASSAAIYLTQNRHREIVPYATAVLMGLGAFFTGLMIFAASPFHALSPAPAEGLGLTPLLRHPSMMVHPPMLYSGYVMWSIPFAFAIGALITRRVDASWIRSTRRFALIAWTFLGIGLLLGSRWSYTELGWGGYWAWDPVENAALMPFLAGTAFLHSVMVQEKRGMLKVWNVSLIVGTFSLCPLGRPPVDPCLRRLDRGRAAVGPDRRRPPRLDPADRLAPRRPALGAADRVADLARGDLPDQQLAAGRHGRGDLLGHLLPADLRGLHRHPLVAGGAVV
jgi:cytochrome c-type biogenesis protein CcmF